MEDGRCKGRPTINLYIDALIALVLRLLVDQRACVHAPLTGLHIRYVENSSRGPRKHLTTKTPLGTWLWESPSLARETQGVS